ncbi:MAG: signal peptidase I [Clostridiales bacterium]|nr:signal peptidase I [Clostridiales bacterium]
MEENMESVHVEQGGDSAQMQKKKSFARQTAETVLYFAVILICVLLVQKFIVQPVEVNGSSMEATLSDSNHLLLEKVSYVFSKPKRFDVVVFRPYDYDKELCYIKRIIGLPGETVQIKDNIIYIDGMPLSENYGRENVIRDPGIAIEPITLNTDEYFVLGDNRNNSKDSRSQSVGTVNKDSILGRAWCRIWPLNDIGFIKHE